MVVFVTGGVIMVHPRNADAHCQVPCGIYDDAARIQQLKEDSTTIAKAVKNIGDLAGQHDAMALNQAVRWVNTKEEHASHIMEVVAQYFLAQRVKPVAAGGEGSEAYLAKLADHHAVLVAAMKTKQSADPATVAALNKAIDRLATHY
jgi:nickel superoxide dismutase